jgi:S1-C subfamily serine protease
MRRAALAIGFLLFLSGAAAEGGDAPEARLDAALPEDALVTARVERGTASWSAPIDVPAGVTRLAAFVWSRQAIEVHLSPPGRADTEQAATSPDGREFDHEVAIERPAEGRWTLVVRHPGFARGGAGLHVALVLDGGSRPPFVHEHALVPTAAADGVARFRFLLPPSAASVRVVAPAAFVAEGPKKASVKGAEGGAAVVRSASVPAGVYVASTTLPAQGGGVSVEDGPPSWKADEIPLGAEVEVALGEGGKGSPASREWTFEVPASAPAVVISCAADHGQDVDVFVRRGAGFEDQVEEHVADYMGLQRGDVETVVLGGLGPPQAGTYHVKAVLAGGTAHADATLLAQVLAAKDAAAASRAPALRPGTWTAGSIEKGSSGMATWTVEAPPSAKSMRAQVIDATSDVDLLALDAATGAIVARSLSDRVEEGLDLPFAGDDAVPRTFRLGVLGRDPADFPTTFRVAIGVDGPPAIPAELRMPPFHDAAKRTPIERAVDAVVEVEAKDGTGSGVCVSPLGLVLTCRHVLELDDAPGKIQEEGVLVGFTDDPTRSPRQQFVARVVESDEALDLALLQIHEDVYGREAPKQGVPYLAIPDNLAVRLGDPLLSIGFPGCGSERCRTPVIVSAGVLSGMEGGHDGVTLLKTDAMVDEGHSGGALVTRDGALIGVVSATLGEHRPLGLAVPTFRVPATWQRRIRMSGGR